MKSLAWASWVAALACVAVACGESDRAGRGPGGGSGGSAGVAGTAGSGASAGAEADAGEGGSAGIGASSGNGNGGLAGTAGASSAGSGAVGTDTAGEGGEGGNESGGAPNATGGAGGEAGNAGEPSTALGENVRRLHHESVGKVDVLLVVDNSISMADKQQLLGDAIPTLVRRLIAPGCVDENGESVGESADPICPQGSAPEFRAATDIHVGVITSSLGSHGGTICVEAEKDDRSELLGVVRTGLPVWSDTGFLVWDPRTPSTDGAHDPAGDSDAEVFESRVREQVLAAGENGCGYESTLEAWYRFLIDAEPVSSMSNDGLVSVRGPINAALLAQRARFLRPDSLVSIIMLTDEDDCSILDESNSQGWLVSYQGTSGAFHMPRASSACAVNPNDPCCRLCQATPAASCPDNTTDTECLKGNQMTSTEDSANLRCFNQAQRFGVDLLYPIRRYRDALMLSSVESRSGVSHPNPLFQAPDGETPRDPSLVMLTGIVGVPWQDISTEASWGAERELEYLSAADLTRPDANHGNVTRWDVILGDPENGVRPLDPHMIASIAPRATGAAHPLLSGDQYRIADATSTTLSNAINGHEQVNVNSDDLQYACTFPLPAPVPCDPIGTGNDNGCDCNANEAGYNRPICQYPNGTLTEGEQIGAKAYPALRHLELLKRLGANGTVASICPKNIAPTSGVAPEDDPYYGYNPAVQGIAARFTDLEPCLAEPLPTDAATDRTTCQVVEIKRETASTGCDASLGRHALVQNSLLHRAIVARLTLDGWCGPRVGVDCDAILACELTQHQDAELDACLAGDATQAPGFCYVDPAAGIGAESVAERCPTDRERVVHFTGLDTPASGATLYLACDLEP